MTMEKQTHNNRTARVIESYTTPYDDPIVIREGDPVETGKTDDDWPGWIWCTSIDGKSGWVPQAVLRQDGEKTIANTNYSARELNVRAGDILTVLREESGWFWCRTPNGNEGWVLAKNVSLN